MQPSPQQPQLSTRLTSQQGQQGCWVPPFPTAGSSHAAVGVRWLEFTHSRCPWPAPSDKHVQLWLHYYSLFKLLSKIIF